MKIYGLQHLYGSSGWDDDWRLEEDYLFATKEAAEKAHAKHAEYARAIAITETLRRQHEAHEQWRRDEALLDAGITRDDRRLLRRKPEPTLRTREEVEAQLVLTDVGVGWTIVELEVEE